MKKIKFPLPIVIILLFILSFLILFFIMKGNLFNTGKTEKLSDTSTILPGITSPIHDEQSDSPKFTVPIIQFDANGIPIVTESPVLSGLDEANKKITVSNEEFYLWLIEIYENMDIYRGYEISITGAVFKDFDNMSENEFVPARLLITHGESELMPVGILCEYEKASALILNTWITVTGIIETEMHLENIEPKIIVSQIENAESVDEFIYP